MTHAVDRMLADIRTLAPDIPSRAANIEAARQMPRDLVDKLKEIGLYRVFVPKKARAAWNWIFRKESG
jgi:hypothetical protein